LKIISDDNFTINLIIEYEAVFKNIESLKIGIADAWKHERMA